jgi:hypothetical protein
MSGTFNDKGELEPSAAAIVSCFGKKGSGKSVMAMLIASSWPYDMVVIDVAGDDGPMPRKPGTGSHDIVELSGSVDELPRTWPEYQRREKRPMILRYVPDPGSSTEAEDMDAVVGLAYTHSSTDRPCMLVIHEIGRAAPAGRTQPHMRRMLNHSRHRGATCLFCGPRPQTVDPLIVAQSDLVYTFELNQPADRKRIAENIGWDPADFDAAVHDLGLHEYLRYDGREPKPEAEGDDDFRLVHFPALPEDVVAATKRWAQGEQHSADAEGNRPQPGRPAAG